MIVVEVPGQEPPQMSLMQDDHVVQAFAANTPNEPLGVRILPWTPWGDHHFLNVQLAQLADDPWCTPGRIALPHGADEIADVFGNRWTAGRAWLAQLSPVVAKALALPGDDGTGLNERQGVLPGRPEPREPPPEQTIAWAKSRAMDCLFID